MVNPYYCYLRDRSQLGGKVGWWEGGLERREQKVGVGGAYYGSFNMGGGGLGGGSGREGEEAGEEGQALTR